MDPEEIRLRSLYLFFTCAHAVEEFKERLLATFPAQPLTAKLVLERALKRELGLLFRYWTTRQIWDRLEDHEADAKRLNLALLRLFTEAFKLPRDGSGLRYAELSTPAEEVRELSLRVSSSLGMEHQPLLRELQAGILPWRDEVSRYTKDALGLSLSDVTTRVKAWAEPSGREGTTPQGGER